MKILVWGAGAIGGSMGAYFIRAGYEVTFVDVSREHVEAINKDGMSIEGPIEAFGVKARAFTPKALEGRWDCILLCTKGHHTELAVKALRPFLSEQGYVVSVQNGLNEHLIAEMLGSERVMGSFVNFGADYMGAGLIHYAGRGAVVLGELDGRISPRLAQIHDLFLSFDDKAVITDNIWGYLWGKMAYGALLYTTAITNESIADALDRAEFEDVFIALGEEVLRIASAESVSPEGFNGFDPQAFMPNAASDAAKLSLKEMVAFNQKSAKTHSGIWRDLAVRKRKTEADAHLGMMIQIAQKHALETPLLENILLQIHEIEAKQRVLSLSNLKELKRALT